MKKFRSILVAILFAIVLCAVSACGKSNVKLSFETNGGNEIQAVQVKKGENYELPVPTRTGYEFDGWFTSEGFEGSAVESVVAESDATFYAKWTRLYTVTLDLDGGTLSSASLSLRAGVNLFNAVQSLVPVKENHQFGGWFKDNVALSTNALMPEENVTLKAKYKVAYRVELYLQNMEDETVYEKAADDVVGYDYAGTEVRADEKVVGFERVIGHESEISSKVLSENASENVFRLYYDRQTFTIVFDPDFPEDQGDAADRFYTVKYGQEITVPVDFELEGNYLIGWTPDDGETIYKANLIENLIRNGSQSVELQPDSFIPEDDMVLKAVWNKGYVDMFDGDDYIFVSPDSGSVVYLYRGGEYFVGSLNERSKEFLFRNKADEIVLKGKINENGTYVYSDSVRNNSSYVLYAVGSGINENISMLFDEFDGIVYYEREGGMITVQRAGYYTIDENNMYTAHFDDGSFNFIVGQANGQNAFQLRNEEEYALGRNNGEMTGLVRFAINNGSVVYFTAAYQMLLDGFGTAVMNMGDSTQSFRYTYDADLQRITLRNALGSVAGVCQIMGSSVQGYMLYDQQYDNVYTSEASGATLTLDGLYSATYFDGTTSVKGVYAVTGTSVLGGSIVKFTSESGAVGAQPVTFTFIIRSETVETGNVGENGRPETVTNFYFEKKHNDYAEYFYKDGNPEVLYYYSPVLILNDTEQGKASVYGYITSTKQYLKVSEGSFIYNSETKLYLYTAERYFDAPDVTVNPFDLSTVKSFVYDLGVVTSSSGSSFNVSYWYSVTTTDVEGGGDTTTDFEAKEYTSDDATLRLVSGFAIYTLKENGNFISSTYTLNGNIVVISTSAGSLYIEINDEDMTLVTLTTPPYTSKEIMEDNRINSNSTLAFDGKGGATYTLKGDEVTVFTGTVEKTNETTVFGAEIYQFVSDGLTFKFIQLFTSSDNLFTRYNESYVGDYRSADGGRLTLDGYGYLGEYFDSNDGTTSRGMYYIAQENVVCMIIDSAYRYFDLKAEKQFTARGIEYGAYILMNNQNADGVYVELDGYGRLSVFTIDSSSSEGERVYIDDNGTYTMEGDEFTLTYNDGNKRVDIVGKRSILIISSQAYNVFVISHKEVARIYVTEKDLTVLVLDEIGGAVRYDVNGVKQVGEYIIITDNMLYYASSQADDACIYIYDDENGTATAINFRERGYYTSDLDSLQFTKYGFAVFNGTTRYYYNIENDEVVIYRRANASGETLTPNAYGFVREVFGSFDDVVEFGGKQYILNSGFEVVFKREEATKDKYPVPISKQGEEDYKRPLEDLRFTPNGRVNFSVSGKVTIDGNDYNCTVTKTDTEMYVQVQYFRFYITATYNGSNNTYNVTAMEHIRTLPSYTYLYYYYMFSMFMGQSVANSMPNTIGEISIVSEYDETGVVTQTLIKSAFGDDSGMFDIDGNILSFCTDDYTVSDGGLYTVNFKAEDGYDYRLYFIITPFSQLGTSGYQVYGMTRVETVVSGEYRVEVERIIATDANFAPGAFFTITLYKNDEKIEPTNIYVPSLTKVYYVVRETTEDEVITSTVYYTIELTEQSDTGAVEGEENSGKVMPIESVSVTMETVETIYSEDGLSFVDISATNGVLMMSVNVRNEENEEDTTYLYFVSGCSYDDVNCVYTVETSAGKTFTVKVNDSEGSKTVEITEVVQEEQEEDQELAA